MRITLPHVALIGVLIIGLGGGGAAIAAIPGGDGKISACYATAGGQLRIVDADVPTGRTCNPDEKPLNWSQTGPQGPAGPSFVRAAYSDVNHRGQSKVLSTLELAPNTAYSVTALADVYRDWDLADPDAANVDCTLAHRRPGGTTTVLDTAGWGVMAGGKYLDGQIQLRSVVTSGYGKHTLEVSCSTESKNLTERPYVTEVRLEAAQVGGYSVSGG